MKMSPVTDNTLSVECQNEQNGKTSVETHFKEQEGTSLDEKVGAKKIDDSVDDMDREKEETDRGELIKKAQNFLAEGRRFLVCRDYQNAVDSLYEACGLFPQLYGEMAAECAEVYLLYGKSLVELERSNQTIFGEKNDNADEEDESEGDDDEEEALDQKAVEEKSDCVEAKDAKENQPSEDKENISVAGEVSAVDQNDKENEDQVRNVDIAGASNGNENVETPGCSSVKAEKTSAEAMEEETNGSNTAEAWETLDVARVIYEKLLTETKDLDEETKKKDMFRLSEVRMTLGEVCALDEKYVEAIQEFTAAHEILKEICAEDDRRVAEIYFQIGTASELNFNFGMAAENIKKAAKVLETRKQNLEKQSEALTADDVDSLTKKEDFENEIKDLNEVLADIQQRLVDLSESQKNSDAVKQNLLELASKKCPVAEETVGATTEKANGHVASATDVSHLIRRPLKRVSDGSSPENEAKRAKIVEEGHEVVKSSENGTKAENNVDQMNENDQKASVEEENAA